MKRLLVIASVICSTAVVVFAQNSNSSTVEPGTRTRTVVPAKPTPNPKPTRTPIPQTTRTPRAPSSEAAGQVSPSGPVLTAFNNLLDAIRKADPKAAVNAYQNTPRLLLFNYNGTITKGWDQLKVNRDASYPHMQDVKLDVRDLRLTMLSATAALITCQWTQSMTFNGTPETDTGRRTIVIRQFGRD